MQDYVRFYPRIANKQASKKLWENRRLDPAQSGNTLKTEVSIYIFKSVPASILQSEPDTNRARAGAKENTEYVEFLTRQRPLTLTHIKIEKKAKN